MNLYEMFRHFQDVNWDLFDEETAKQRAVAAAEEIQTMLESAIRDERIRIADELRRVICSAPRDELFFLPGKIEKGERF